MSKVVPFVAKAHPIDQGFGGCPICHGSSGYLNVGPEHYFFCHEHKTKWCVGSNLFGCWREESDEEWLRNEYRLANYRTVEPVCK
jgi:hypothetical protein